MLELYHNGVSTCSQKVRMILAEKGLDYTSHPVDLIAGEQHAPAYIKLNPNHVVPTLVNDGAVFIESTLINEYLDEAFPEPPMRPAEPAGRHAVRLWIKRFDESIQGAIGVVTFAIGPRRMLLDQPEEVREANINAMNTASRPRNSPAPWLAWWPCSTTWRPPSRPSLGSRARTLASPMPACSPMCCASITWP